MGVSQSRGKQDQLRNRLYSGPSWTPGDRKKVCMPSFTWRPLAIRWAPFCPAWDDEGLCGKGSLPVIEDLLCASCWRHQMDKTETTSLLGSKVFTVLWNGYVVMTWSLGTRGSLSMASLFILGSSAMLNVARGLQFLKSAFPKSNFWCNEAC